MYNCTLLNRLDIWLCCTPPPKKIWAFIFQSLVTASWYLWVPSLMLQFQRTWIDFIYMRFWEEFFKIWRNIIYTKVYLNLPFTRWDENLHCADRWRWSYLFSSKCKQEWFKAPRSLTAFLRPPLASPLQLPLCFGAFLALAVCLSKIQPKRRQDK